MSTRLGRVLGTVARLQESARLVIRGPALLATSTRVSTTSVISQFDKIRTEEQANEVVERLSGSERRLLHAALRASLPEDVPRPPLLPIEETGEEVQGEQQLSPEATKTLFLVNALPFVGFGVLDNMIMIIAGEYIDQSLGAWLCLSTMAAAALGNLISDVAGVGLAHYVESLVNRAGIKHPVLTARQLESGRARFVTNFGRAVGLSVGCIIGMFPLLFYDSDGKKEEDKDEKAA